MSIVPLQFWFALALVLLVGGVGLVADLALYRAYPELKDHDWGWLFRVWHRCQLEFTQWRARRARRHAPRPR